MTQNVVLRQFGGAGAAGGDEAGGGEQAEGADLLGRGQVTVYRTPPGALAARISAKSLKMDLNWTSVWRAKFKEFHWKMTGFVAGHRK